MLDEADHKISLKALDSPKRNALDGSNSRPGTKTMRHKLHRIRTSGRLAGRHSTLDLHSGRDANGGRGSSKSGSQQRSA
jgi:hypothetical protein